MTFFNILTQTILFDTITAEFHISHAIAAYQILWYVLLLSVSVGRVSYIRISLCYFCFR